MPVSDLYAEQMRRENNPILECRQYQAQEMGDGAYNCDECVAGKYWTTNKSLCNALPPCARADRLDGRDVVFVEVGPAPEQKGVAE